MFKFRKQFYQYNRYGFTLVEVLFSLSITMIIVMSIGGLYALISHNQNISDFSEDIYIGAKQASQYVIGTEYVDVSEQYQYHDRDGQEMILEYDNHRLVKREGYEILIHNIDDISFEIQNDFIYMTVTRDEHDYTFMLTYAKMYEEELEETDNEEIE